MSGVRVWNDDEQRYVVIADGQQVYSPPSVRPRKPLTCHQPRTGSGGDARTGSGNLVASASPANSAPPHINPTSPGQHSPVSIENHEQSEMTGRLLGQVVLPPENSKEWKLAPSTIYGCPLCYIINNPGTYAGTCCSQVSDHQFKPIDFSPEILPKHKLTITSRDISSKHTYSICASMGHVYLRKVDSATFDPSIYTPVNDKVLTLTTEELSFGKLFIHHGKFYNHSADILVGLKTKDVLIGLTKEHYKLEQFGLHGDLYRGLRNNYLQILDGYLVPEEVKLDNTYGHRMVKMIVEAIDFNVYSGIKLERLMIKSAFGKVYQAQLPIDKLIFKYQVLSSSYESNVWELERQNSEFINRNLDQRPNLPYPYTYQMYRCGQLPNVEKLTQPSCPIGNDSIGVFVQEYVNSRGALNDFIEEFTVESLDLLIEALAVVAETHQGDTVKHHFMHLDAHTGNFLISDCGPKDRICDLNNNRVTNFGPFQYKFDTHGHRVYMIDFGLSHFLDGRSEDPYNPDLPSDIRLDSTLYPAFDFITLYRGGMSEVVESALSDRVTDDEEPSQNRVVSDEHFNHIIRATQIGAAMIADHLKMQAIKRVEFDEDDLTNLPKQPIGMVDVLNPNEVSKLIYDTPAENLQVTLIRLVEMYIRELDGASREVLSASISVVSILTGLHYQNIEDGILYMDRNIYIEELEPLSDSALELLSITEPVPDVTGVPLYLWYLRAAGVPIAID